MINWPQRIRKIVVPADFLESLFSEGKVYAFKVEQGLPAGAQLVSAFFNAETRQTTLVFQYDEWDLVHSVIDAPPVSVTWTSLQRDSGE